MNVPESRLPQDAFNDAPRPTESESANGTLAGTGPDKSTKAMIGMAFENDRGEKWRVDSPGALSVRLEDGHVEDVEKLSLPRQECDCARGAYVDFENHRLIRRASRRCILERLAHPDRRIPL